MTGNNRRLKDFLMFVDRQRGSDENQNLDIDEFNQDHAYELDASNYLPNEIYRKRFSLDKTVDR